VTADHDLDRAIGLLGPLEGRIMRAVWTGQAGEAFVVRDVQALMPELAYTTVMTTLHRLAAKGLLGARAEPGLRAHEYRVAQSPAAYLAAASDREAAEVVARYGEAAQMTVTQCLTAATTVVLGASVLAMTARAAWLGTAAARAVAALPRARPPDVLAGAARRAGIRRIRCLAGSGCTAFCAGLLRPRVYATAAVAALAPAELDAVLAHEAAHARRRDPLRRLLARAAADAMFWLPLVRWWSGRQAEGAELSADQAAVGYAGRQAVASALLAAVAGHSGGGAARVAQLLGDELPARRPAPALVILSVAGLIAAVWLTMCLGQAALAWAGLP
jgi:Zn-dependent protease with chaperone function